MSDRPLIIAVDGPAASGKTTLARRLAEDLGLPFLDTGLLYRAVARRLIDAGSEIDDREAAVAAALAVGPAELDSDRLRDADVGQGASRVAAIPAVRSALMGLQRDFGGAEGGAVLAGRDVGTVVRPEAVCKVFVTATLEERVRRRLEELRARGVAAIYGEVLDELRQRDERDRNRLIAPLMPARDALVIDTTERDVDGAFAAARGHVAAKARI